MMRDISEGISIFVEAVEAGSFSRAADQLSLTRSAIGKAVARLEARLGSRLFHRTTRVQALTEEGQAYYRHCRRALDELREGEHLLEAGKMDVAGPLRISMPVLLGRHCVLPVLLDLAERHSRLDLDLRFSDLIVDVVGEGIDLAVRTGPTVDGSGLLTRRLASHRKVVCAAPSYLEANGIPQGVSDLADHAALVYWRNGKPFPWVLEDSDGSMRPAHLSWRLRFDDLEAILFAALAGLGIAFLPEWLVRMQLQNGQLRALLSKQEATPTHTFAVWPNTPHLPRRLRLVIDTLAAQLPQRDTGGQGWTK